MEWVGIAIAAAISAAAGLFVGFAARTMRRGMARESASSSATAQIEILKTAKSALEATNAALSERIDCLEHTVGDQNRRIAHLEQLVRDTQVENRRLRAVGG